VRRGLRAREVTQARPGARRQGRNRTRWPRRCARCEGRCRTRWRGRSTRSAGLSSTLPRRTGARTTRTR